MKLFTFYFKRYSSAVSMHLTFWYYSRFIRRHCWTAQMDPCIHYTTGK